MKFKLSAAFILFFCALSISAVALSAEFTSRDLMVTGATVMGDADAKVTLIEYSDYQCLYCARHSIQTMPAIIKNYIDQGKVKFIKREFPIPNLHQQSETASMAALCAGSQGKYWQMQQLLFENQTKMFDSDLRSYASQIELDTIRFDLCIEQNEFADRIEKDILEGEEMGVLATPGFALGFTDPTNPDKIRVEKYMYGARGYEHFAKAIDELLANE